MLKVFKQTKTDVIPFVYEYLLSVPPDYDRSTKRWPLLLFLHGAGERFPPIEKVINHGPPKLIQVYSTTRQNSQPSDDSSWESARILAENFVTCAPQVNEGYGWNDHVLIDLIHQVQHSYRIDPNRIYCTGISMGGYGTWSLAMAKPDLFAAILPICGGGDKTKVSCLQHLPIWNFHGQLDDIVPIEESNELINALNSERCRSTIYPDLEHDSWTKTYDNKDIFLWLLAQIKRH